MNVRRDIAKELHKQVRKNFPSRYVEIKGLNDLYQADLVEMIQFSKVNKGYKYILVIIDCFSKYAIAVPVKSKSAYEIEKALKPVLDKHPMRHLQTDKGTEFYNVRVKSLLDKYNINHYSTFSDKKASIVERLNRTLKSKMWQAFSEQGSYKWLDLLQKIVQNYNNTRHRTIGMKPIEVNKNNEFLILKRLIKNRKLKVIKRSKFNRGDKVRISRFKKQFTKGYLPNWSNEIYTIWRVQSTVPVTYLLKDETGNIIKGGFYEQELSKTKISDVYLIEKVIRKKGNKLLVRWLGFDKSSDTWIDKKDLK